mmetsp:Transcript_87142/g.244463  ORF Transcript_87142/g.244463 Transcript_87142/m.244463 type:complete len:203 (+) Transcript_87142:1770-2378(+)
MLVNPIPTLVHFRLRELFLVLHCILVKAHVAVHERGLDKLENEYQNVDPHEPPDVGVVHTICTERCLLEAQLLLPLREHGFSESRARGQQHEGREKENGGDEQNAQNAYGAVPPQQETCIWQGFRAVAEEMRQASEREDCCVEAPEHGPTKNAHEDDVRKRAEAGLNHEEPLQLRVKRAQNASHGDEAGSHAQRFVAPRGAR